MHWADTELLMTNISFCHHRHFWLTSHTLSAHSRTAGIFIHALHGLASLAITVLVVIPILLCQASLSGLTLRDKLPVAVDP